MKNEPIKLLTSKISRTVATTMHNDFMNNTPPPPGTVRTKATFFSYEDLESILKSAFDIEVNLVNLPGRGFYCYFAKHASITPTVANRNTVIVAFAEDDPDNAGELRLIDDQIWDFGDLCPDRCPTNSL